VYAAAPLGVRTMARSPEMALGYSSADGEPPVVGAVCANASEIPLASNAVAATRVFTVTIYFFIVLLLCLL